MMKTVLKIIAKRYWGLAAGILLISGFSQYRQMGSISLAALLLIMIAIVGAITLIAVPLEMHKIRKQKRD
ncbi:hypothetical protein GTP38_15865 [Duganella sp. FT94W]|uniref:Uncharacterized protein n=1 Tax=Duganella lactea TaxID=2692173 RepID=A0ABW9VAK7_9BURK|nr:hypothetical protein [Duganella lactea]MYM35812.1 hypothetical protein [Duganella lactea]